MPENERSIDDMVPAKIDLIPDHRKKITQLLTERPDRFLDARDFVGKAIDVFLTWERNPEKASTKMAEMEPTLEQYALMSQMMQPEELERMYPGYPENFGDKWNEFRKSYQSVGSATITGVAKRQHEARQSEKDFEDILENILKSYEFIKQVKFDEISVDGFDEIVFDEWPLLFTHYSRLLPAKIGVITLVNMMRAQKSPVIDLDDFKIKAYDIAEEISTKIIKFEKENKKTRDEKKSTGLPRPFLSGEITSAQAIKEQRYRDRYFGKIVRSKDSGEVHFEGLMMALGLIRIFVRNKEAKITLTDTGKKFCLFENPIFMGKMDMSLSKDESEFLSTKCIPQRPLELKMIQNAITVIRGMDYEKTTDVTNALDDVCYDTVLKFVTSGGTKRFGSKIQSDIIARTDEIRKDNREIEQRINAAEGDLNEVRKLKRMLRQTPIQACRIATMGRMSEIGIVMWKINESGRSEYTITDHKLVESISKLNPSETRSR